MYILIRPLDWQPAREPLTEQLNTAGIYMLAWKHMMLCDAAVCWRPKPSEEAQVAEGTPVIIDTPTWVPRPSLQPVVRIHNRLVSS